VWTAAWRQAARQSFLDQKLMSHLAQAAHATLQRTLLTWRVKYTLRAVRRKRFCQLGRDLLRNAERRQRQVRRSCSKASGVTPGCANPALCANPPLFTAAPHHPPGMFGSLSRPGGRGQLRPAQSASLHSSLCVCGVAVAACALQQSIAAFSPSGDGRGRAGVGRPVCSSGAHLAHGLAHHASAAEPLRRIRNAMS
jgi:hypothetical protein